MHSSRLSWIALAAAALALIVCHWHWAAQLPERVAIHFDAAGRPNGWSPRGGLFLSSLPVHLGLAAFLAVLGAVMHRLPPGLINLPNKSYWTRPEIYPQVCRYLAAWLRWLAAAMLVWGGLLDRQLVLANQVQPPRLDSSAVWMLTGGLLAFLLLLTVRLLLKFSKTPPPVQPG
jgi:hypothetical protein